jgi:hypothetical protein
VPVRNTRPLSTVYLSSRLALAISMNVRQLRAP